MKNTTDEVIKVWQDYLQNVTDWHKLIKNIQPKQSGCGLIYELHNPIARSQESFAIADMRSISFTEPHYHTNGETEIYFVLQGSGLQVVGKNEQAIKKDDVIVISPDTGHFTIPHENLILALVNTPPFNAKNSISLNESNKEVQFDKNQFERLIQS